ncbi:MAG: putative ABC transporter permease, partial [Mycoplasmatales bacterium]
MTNNLVLIFLVYSFLGWIAEVLYVGLISQRKFYNRGFLHLPIIPLYGFGALLILSSVYKLPINILLKLGIIMVLTTILEYLTALIMDHLFHIKWWDYSQYKFNIQGRVCLINSLLFGVGGLVILKIHPYLENIITKVNTPTLDNLEIILLVFIMLDLYITLKRLTKINVRDIRYFSQGRILLPKYEYNIRHLRTEFAKNFLEHIFGWNLLTLILLLMLTKNLILSLALTIFIIGIT